MLLKLAPAQVAENWELIAPAIEGSLPPQTFDTYEVLNNILRALMTGIMDCWFIVEKGEALAPKILGVITTTVSVDHPSMCRVLLIYSAFAFVKVRREFWQGVLDTLMTYAKTCKCHKLAAFSGIENVISITAKMGADVSTRYIQMEVK